MKAILLILLVTILFSCNKEKRFSKRLIEPSTWKVTVVDIGNEQANVFGNWNIPNVNIYNTVPWVTWTDNGKDARFQWQFQDKGKTFELNYTCLCDENDGAELDTLDYICYNISGKYKVLKKGKHNMEFSCSNTRAYSGKEVKIVLENLN
jgi:hypothetical protein